MRIVVALFGKMRELAHNPAEAGFKNRLGDVVVLPSLEMELYSLAILRDMMLVIHNKYVKSYFSKKKLWNTSRQCLLNCFCYVHFFLHFPLPANNSVSLDCITVRCRWRLWRLVRCDHMLKIMWRWYKKAVKGVR